jgi:hypothetical protein
MVTMVIPRNDVESQILTPEASQFLTRLAQKFEARRQELLARRKVRQQQLDAGALPDFLPETAQIRESEWTVAPIPHDLLDRRVEITGPVDRKMIINALNSGASVFMADLRIRIRRRGRTTSRGRRTCGMPSRERSGIRVPKESSIRLIRRWRRCWCGHAGGIWRNGIFWWTGSRSRGRCSISDFTSFTMQRR